MIDGLHGGVHVHHSHAGNQIMKKPWQSPAVLSLASRLGMIGHDTVQPMVVEGPAGTVLSAVGEEADHRIAGDILQQCQEDRVSRGEPMPFGLVKGQERSFGLVYEHKDSFGKPVFVGHSSGIAEERFKIDKKAHQSVKNLLTYENGKSEVVWAGSGTFPVGHEQMKAMRTHICEARAERNNIEKLTGPKPYSRHGY